MKLENHSHGVTTVMVDGCIAKAKMSEEEMKRTLGDFMAITNAKVQQFDKNEDIWDPTHQSIFRGDNILLFYLFVDDFLSKCVVDNLNVVVVYEKYGECIIKILLATKVKFEDGLMKKTIKISLLEL